MVRDCSSAVRDVSAAPRPCGYERLSGSLVNVVTAYAFLDQAAAEGHCRFIVTTGSSATGRALTVLARRRGMSSLSIIRSDKAKESLLQSGVEHVVSSSYPGFMLDLASHARELGITAVFDGVGGALISKILVALAAQSTI